jgi:hypothetical protein
VLNIYKPAGVTPYGWRKQREQRQKLRQSAPRAMSTVVRVLNHAGEVRRAPKFRVVASQVAYFTLHFGEMWFAMTLFISVRIALNAQGYVAFLDATSVDFQAAMGLLMVLPMVTWMRVRGCSWRQSGEMSTAMLLPTGIALVLRALGQAEALLRVSNYQHAAMLVGMLALMLYRREHYISGYAFGRWPGTSRGRIACRRLEALARREHGVNP